MLSVGVIGYKNHAKRMINVVNTTDYAKVDVIYYPSKLSNVDCSTVDKYKLLKCDAVMIVSPNHTHFEYLKWLSNNYDGYVLCEKPIVTSQDQLEKLSVDPKKYYFNFNQRFGKLRDVVSKSMEDESLGKPLHLSLSVTQGLAYKSSYIGSWRAKATNNMHGIVETKAIHYIDLCNLLFGELEQYSYVPINISGNGESYDTCNISLKYYNGLTADLFFSYAASYTNQMVLIGTNGSVEYNDGAFDVLSPRDSFNSEGMFVKPPSIYEKNDFNSDMYLYSLKESVNYFLLCCKENRSVDKNLYISSISTSKLIFEITES